MTTPDPWHEIADALVEIGEKLSDVRNGLKDLRKENPYSSVFGAYYVLVGRVQEIKKAARRVVTLLTTVEDVFRDVSEKESERVKLERAATFKQERPPQ